MGLRLSLVVGVLVFFEGNVNGDFVGRVHGMFGLCSFGDLAEAMHCEAFLGDARACHFFFLFSVQYMVVVMAVGIGRVN